MITTSLVPSNLALLGVARRGNGVEADLETIWLTPYPVLTNYVRWCAVINVQPFAGGTYSEQGSASKRGYILSGYRDKTIEGNILSPHKFGFAIDVAIGDIKEQLMVVPPAWSYFTRIGLYPDNGFIHLDLAPDNWIQKYNKKRCWIKHEGKYTSFDDQADMMDYANRLVA